MTRKRTAQTEQIYINNALVIRDKSNAVLTNKDGKKQVLHVINEVLEPLIYIPSNEVDGYVPQAFQLMSLYESLNLGKHTLKNFRSRVILNKKENVFMNSGAHTYFIPVDEGFKPPPRSDIFDKKVIDSHIVPNRVIFTAAAPLEEPLPTLTFEDNAKVQVTMFTRTEGKETKSE